MSTIVIHGTEHTITESLLANLEDDELISYCKDSTDPLIVALIERLETANELFMGIDDDYDG